jgi:transcriptional regulator with XRE-family HTH domain
MQSGENSLLRLREWIDTKGWTNKEFAERMNIQPSHVAKYLDGRLNLKNLHLPLMREGCDLHWLETGERRQDPASDEKMMLEMLRSAGISTPEQLRDFLDPADMAKDIQEIVTALFQRRRGLR